MPAFVAFINQASPTDPGYAVLDRHSRLRSLHVTLADANAARDALNAKGGK